MRRLSRGWSPLFVPALMTAMAALPAAAQDVVRLGSASGAAGSLVNVPVLVRDAANAPLSGSGDPDLTVRGLAVSVEYSPASAVASVQIVAAGITADLSKRFESQVPGASRHGWIVAFDDDVPITGAFQAVAQVRVQLAAGAAPGTSVELRLDAATTALSNGRGSVVETAGNGLLRLDDGSIAIDTSCTTAHTLCLLDDRFLVDVTWRNFEGATGVGNAVALTSDAGYFWFFNDTNVEAVIKVLDGRALNDHFWVFYGALSNVEYEITVTDSVTGEIGTYFNPAGQFASVGDTEAFAGTGSAGLGGGAIELEAPRYVPATKQAGCTADLTTLCLLGGRFRLEMSWTDFQGDSGTGRAVQLTDDAGYFWFFNRDNVELVVKTLDGRAINGNFWVFYGALSNVEFTLAVTDTVTGDVKTYSNPLGTFASMGDTAAF